MALPARAGRALRRPPPLRAGKRRIGFRNSAQSLRPATAGAGQTILERVRCGVRRQIGPRERVGGTCLPRRCSAAPSEGSGPPLSNRFRLRSAWDLHRPDSVTHPTTFVRTKDGPSRLQSRVQQPWSELRPSRPDAVMRATSLVRNKVFGSDLDSVGLMQSRMQQLWSETRSLARTCTAPARCSHRATTLVRTASARCSHACTNLGPNRHACTKLGPKQRLWFGP